MKQIKKAKQTTVLEYLLNMRENEKTDTLAKAKIIDDSCLREAQQIAPSTERIRLIQNVDEQNQKTLIIRRVQGKWCLITLLRIKPQVNIYIQVSSFRFYLHMISLKKFYWINDIVLLSQNLRKSIQRRYTLSIKKKQHKAKIVTDPRFKKRMVSVLCSLFFALNFN